MSRLSRGQGSRPRRAPMHAGDLLARLARPSSGARGSLLLAMLVVMTIMSIVMADWATKWEFVMKREREKELIFRGLQFARGIQEWQTQGGKAPPTTLEIMTRPPKPTLRRVYDDPVTARYDDEGNLVENTGQWVLIGPEAPEGAPSARSGPPARQGSAPAPASTTAGSGGSGRFGGKPQITAILGVQSTSEELSIGQFQESGAEVPYSDWKFRVIGQGRSGLIEGGFEVQRPPGFGGFRPPGGTPITLPQQADAVPTRQGNPRR